nr:hypothetical protein [Tanacetum cinerariifolium]
MRHDTSSYSNQPQKESINLINVFNDSSEDFLKDLFSTNQPSGNPTFPSHPEITLLKVKDDIFDPEGGNVLPDKLQDLNSTKDLHPPHHLGLPELLSTRMTLELANRAICTPAGIVRDVFILVSKFTFPADFFIVDYESDLRVPLILGRPFLRTARALIDVHEGGNVLPDKLQDLNSTKDLHPPHHVNPLSGSTTSSYSPNQLLKEFTDELALITFSPEYDDDLQINIEFDLKEIEYLLHHDPIKDTDSILKDSIDQSNLAGLNDNLVDYVPEISSMGELGLAKRT